MGADVKHWRQYGVSIEDELTAEIRVGQDGGGR